jgi:hypothetical protein
MKRAVRAVASIEHGTYDDETMADEATRMHCHDYRGKWVERSRASPGSSKRWCRRPPRSSADSGNICEAQASVKIAFEQTGVSAHGDNARELGYMVQAGVPGSRRSARRHSGDAAEQEGRLGTLKPERRRISLPFRAIRPGTSRR